MRAAVRSGADCHSSSARADQPGPACRVHRRCAARSVVGHSGSMLLYSPRRRRGAGFRRLWRRIVCSVGADGRLFMGLYWMCMACRKAECSLRFLPPQPDPVHERRHCSVLSDRPSLVYACHRHRICRKPDRLCSPVPSRRHSQGSFCSRTRPPHAKTSARYGPLICNCLDSTLLHAV